MCFYIHDDFKKVRIAEEDIPVHKGLDSADYHAGEKWKSSWQNTPVLLSTLMTSDLEKPAKRPINGKRVLSINIGLHSIHPKGHYFMSECTFKAYIPKGAKYYHNPSTREYVSDKLFITDEKI